MSWSDWPIYSQTCQEDMAGLLRLGGRLTAYRANPDYGTGPMEGSWAWRAERLAEEIHKAKHVIVCQSGTQALETLLRALRPAYRTVTTSPLTFSATVAAIQMAGLVPLFTDVTTPEGHLDAVLTPYTFALHIDLFGKQDPHAVVADSCQAVGIPPVARHGVWSFNGRKNVPAGEGGAIYTQDSEVAERCREFLNHAENFKRRHIGWNGHMNEQTALLVYHGLQEVVERNGRRRELAHVLARRLGNHPRLTLPQLDRHALYVYPLVMDIGAHATAERLRALGWESQPGYLTPTLEEYPAFAGLGRPKLPHAHALSQERLLILPQVTPTATETEMEALGEALLRALA